MSLKYKISLFLILIPFLCHILNSSIAYFKLKYGILEFVVLLILVCSITYFTLKYGVF